MPSRHVSVLTTPPRHSLFLSAAHAFSDFFVDGQVFERNLYHSILLNRHVAIPDNAILIGEHVSSHVHDSRSPRSSLLELGLRNGWIVPVLRGGECFAENLEVLIRTNRKAICRNAPELASQLDEAIVQIARWPSLERYHLGEGLARLVQECFAREALPVPPLVELDTRGREVLGVVNEFWRTSRSWRDDWIPRAMQASQSGPESFELVEMLDVASEELLGAPAGEIQSPNELLGHLRHAAGITPELRISHALFWKKLCELYNRNMATAFRCRSTSPQSDPYCMALDLVDTDSAPPDEADAEFSEYAIVEFPTMSLLRQLSPATLADIRSSNEAQDYFDAQERVLSASGAEDYPHLSSLREAWSDCLERYLHSIRRRAESDDGFEKRRLLHKRLANVVFAGAFVSLLGSMDGVPGLDADWVQVLGEVSADNLEKNAGRWALGATLGALVLGKLSPRATTEKTAVSTSGEVATDVAYPTPL